MRPRTPRPGAIVPDAAARTSTGSGSRPARVVLAALTLAVLMAACSTDGADGDATGGVSGELLVFAAASLTEAFAELGDAFVAANPDLEVVFNHAGSQTLASQINEGAPADVFASANITQMDAVAAAGNLAGEPAIFTANLLEIAVESGNPLAIRDLTDLADPDVILVLPAEAVPAGRYARQALDAAGIEVVPSSLERDVRAALSKVELGEADASIVYASDIVASASRADGVAIPSEQNVAASYPVAVLAGAPNPTAADAFVAFVRSDAGQEILTAHGFAAP
ncbi:MAG: molybdate ABC transporter substrate-binding protein [Nitriliruptoraceae bacterium]